ncbi:Neuron-specific calcium-binding protein hippocalcin [Phytophthora megakarya]|uniref:Neuron-specific calcium-binding protein hippocalcin n=1 Tax=Phytophthora megakarya TaxID=4795 RepID=A0A225WKP3_9STRA|nr:Neuron-specific calcium-binding protein hippocalcin [Phytophthora megakarya]
MLEIKRIAKMLSVYRAWVNVEGVEGGMALTRRELQAVLEFRERDRHVDFLFETFGCQSLSTKSDSEPRVDLMTLLTTAAMLAQGSLADKARLVFSLADLDTEDDIVEAELALIISTCCNGLFRLGLIEEGDNLSEMDALAVAYEAFDFVDLEDGDKMTFAMFLKWCVFHPRPKALLGRVSCLFSMYGGVRAMKEALQEQTDKLNNVETFRNYDELPEEWAEKVKVAVGPIVAKVRESILSCC